MLAGNPRERQEIKYELEIYENKSGNLIDFHKTDKPLMNISKGDIVDVIIDREGPKANEIKDLIVSEVRHCFHDKDDQVIHRVIVHTWTRDEFIRNSIRRS